MAYGAPERQAEPKPASSTRPRSAPAGAEPRAPRGRSPWRGPSRYPLRGAGGGDLARRYGDVIALDGLSFTVEPGQLFGFVGPNGAGKTTTMRIILGVLEPDAGAVRWRGRPSTSRRGARFGYMPEERGLYPKMRVRDQLAYFASLHGSSRPTRLAATDGWLERLGIADRAGDRVETLSLGNQQRVQLGAALVHGPELLVLDEPFSGLDPVGVDVLSGVLRGLATGRAGAVLLAPARAGGAAVRVGGDRQGRAAGGLRAGRRAAPAGAAG